jgi:predicted aldo/keto reductase-like oxidoreductase
VKEAADFDRLLDEQRARLGVERLDAYLLHSLNATWWPKMRDLGVLGWLDRVRGSDRVGLVGFSFHDCFDLFRAIVDGYAWDLCQIQYNLANERVQAGAKGLRLAAERGLAVAVMEPLLGGCLANPPESVRAHWDALPARRSPAAWALHWLWNQPEVGVVLSGMSTMDQVRENLAAADASGMGRLTEAERAAARAVQHAYHALRSVPCTACGYCLPCPQGVDIPRNLQLYADAEVFAGGHVGLNRALYHNLAKEMRAESCTACRQCEAKCPQQIPVSEVMPRVHERLGK